MAVTATPIYAQSISNASFVATTTATTAYSAGVNGARVHVFSCCNTTTGSVDLTVFIGGVAATNQVSVVAVPASSGNNNSTPPVDVLRSTQMPSLAYDAYGNKVIDLAPNGVIAIKASSGNVLACHFQAGSF